MRFFLTLLILFLIPSKADARSFTADVHLRSIYIDYKFSGLNVLMYGSQEEPGNIVVALRGPEHDYVIRKKSKIGGFKIGEFAIGGIWANTQSLEIKGAPAVYGLASGLRDLRAISNDTLLENLEISPQNLNFEYSEDAGLSEEEKEEFTNAFMKYMQKQNLYSDTLSPVSFWAASLFRTDLKFPKSIDDGKYNVDIYLFTPDGMLSAMQFFPIEVSKVGFEALVHDMAHNNSVLYGLICVLIAVFAGWFANVVLSQLRR